MGDCRGESRSRCVAVGLLGEPAGPRLVVVDTIAEAPHPGPHPLLTLVRWVLGLATLLGAALAVLGFVDGDGWIPVVQAFLPVAGLVGIVVAVLSVLARARWVAVVALLSSLALLLPVLPWRPRPAEAPDGPVLSVVTINVQYGRADPDALLRVVDERQADVLVILEATPGFWRTLQDKGLRKRLPFATGTVHTSASGTIVATRAAVECLNGDACGTVVERRPGGPDPFEQVDVRLADGTVLRGAHPVPPGLHDQGQWRAGLARQAAWVHQAHAKEPRLVITGDFNASASHPAFRRVAKGMTRAPQAWPWQPTWPQEYRVPRSCRSTTC